MKNWRGFLVKNAHTRLTILPDKKEIVSHTHPVLISQV